MAGTRMNKQGKRIIVFLATIVIVLVFAGGMFAMNFISKWQNEKDISQETQSAGHVEGTDNTGTEPTKTTPLPTETTESKETNPSGSETQTVVEPEPELVARGYCNTFAGYTSAIIANGGLTTQDGSYFDEAGINVEITIEDNDDVIIQDFMDGKIDFFYMTVNKMSYVCKQLKDAGIEVVIPYLSDTSTGGDGIITNSEFRTIESLQNTRVGMARNSASEAVQIWLLNQSGLDSETVQKIIDNFALYDSTQEAVDAFLNGDIGAVSTWDITTALSAKDSHLLFSTEHGEYLVIDALIFNKRFAEENPDVVQKIIDGSIQVVNDMNSSRNIEQSYEIIRTAMPDFSDYDDQTMAEVLADSQYLGYNRNIEAFDIAKDIYVDFCDIWEQLGFETDPEYVTSLFDNSFLNSLANKWEKNETNVGQDTVVADQEQLEDRDALITKVVHLSFEPNYGYFLEGHEEENYALLDEFVKVAKVLNRTVIKIEGNVSLTPGNVSTEFDYSLSRLRAEAARDYMVEQGIQESRIVIVANGGDKPIVPNNTAENRQINRNCIISFYQGEEE